MTTINDFEPLRQLDDAILAEMVREGEARLAAQLEVASAADQRAMTLAGFLITIATGALGGAGALIATDKYPGLALFVAAYAIVIAVASVMALSSASPEFYHLPGNRPRGWLPENWVAGAGGPHDFKQARIEQAFALDGCIQENVASAAVRAKRFNRAFEIAVVFTIMCAAVGALASWMSLPPANTAAPAQGKR